MKSFFQKSERKYLRKKSDLVQDYMIGGTLLVSIGLFVNYYNNKLNPPDPQEDTDSQEIGYICKKKVLKVGIVDHYYGKISNSLQATRGQRIQFEQMKKKLEESQKSQIVRVLVPENK